LTVVLLLVETAFLAIFLPETRGKGTLPDLDDLDGTPEKTLRKEFDSPTAEERLRLLGILKRYHFFFLAIFSGAYDLICCF
jgi:hypothetical protein